MVGATFSGTETLLRMRATVVDRDAVPKEVGSDGVKRIVPAPDGFGGDLAAGRAVTGLGPSSDLLVTLPPIVPPEGYTGEVTVRVGAMVVSAGAGPIRIEGDWVLTVAGPPPSDMAEVLRVEYLGEATVAVGGKEATVRAVRSTSETRVTIVLPAGLQMITQPMLVDGVERVGPYSGRERDGEPAMSFPPTPFESEVALELGAVIKIDSADTPPLVIDLGAALERSPKGSEEFLISPEDVLSGPAELVLGGEQGKHGTRSWVGVVVSGNWHPDDEVPAIFDAAGRQLERASVEVGYRKADDGSVLEGTTSIGAFLDKISQVGVITVVLGGQSEIVSQGERVTLRPE